MLTGEFTSTDKKFRDLKNSSFKYNFVKDKIKCPSSEAGNKAKQLILHHFELSDTLKLHLDNAKIHLQPHMLVEFADVVIYKVNSDNILEWHDQHEEDRSILPKKIIKGKIGRNKKANDCQLVSKAVSREHAFLEKGWL